MVIKRKAPKAAGSRKSATAAATETVGALNLEKEFHSLRAQLGKAYEIEIEQLQKSLAKAKLQAERLAKKLLAARGRQKEATAKVAAES